MAGPPAPLAAVQAAVLKQAAGSQAQQPAEGTVAPQGAIARDLSIMADQAKVFTEGVESGNVLAEANRGSQAQRLAAERRAADAERRARQEAEELNTQSALQSEKLRTESIKQSIQLARQKAGIRQARAQADARSAQLESERELALESRFNAGREVQKHAQTHYGDNFSTLLSKLLTSSQSTKEAMKTYDSIRFFNPTADLPPRDITRLYVVDNFRALNGQRPTHLKNLAGRAESTTPSSRSIIESLLPFGR